MGRISVGFLRAFNTHRCFVNLEEENWIQGIFHTELTWNLFFRGMPGRVGFCLRQVSKKCGQASEVSKTHWWIPMSHAPRPALPAPSGATLPLRPLQPHPCTAALCVLRLLHRLSPFLFPLSTFYLLSPLSS